MPCWSKIWIRLLARSPTNTRPWESSAIVCGTLNSPGPEPVLPQDIRNVPSAANLDTRLAPGAKLCPSVMKILTARGNHDVGRLVEQRRIARCAPLADHQKLVALGIELHHPVPTLVSHPDVARVVEIQTVREVEHPRTPAQEQPARRVELQQRRLGPSGAGVLETTAQQVDVAVGSLVGADERRPVVVGAGHIRIRQLAPRVHPGVGVGQVVGRRHPGLVLESVRAQARPPPPAAPPPTDRRST